MEEIRTKYYAQLKRFITMPTTFQGVSDVSSSIFPVMVTRYGIYNYKYTSQSPYKRA